MRRPELEIYSRREASQVTETSEGSQLILESWELIFVLASTDVRVSKRPTKLIVTSVPLIIMEVVMLV